MKNIFKVILSFYLFFTISTSLGGIIMAQENQNQTISKNGTRPSIKGSSDFFTGNVRIDPLSPAYPPAHTSSAYVTFEPGARSNWHTHPLGQTLIVTAGVCWTQEWDGKKVITQPGDVIWCPKDIKHWHGASPDVAMTHISIVEEQDGKAVDWLEPVTDEQYHSE